MTTRLLAPLSAAAAIAFAVAACSNPTEKAADQKAAAMEKGGEVQADVLENAADKAPTKVEEKTLDQHADAVEKSTEHDADAVRKAAEKAN